VFQALTDPRQTAQWWGQKGKYHHTGWNADVRPGGAWRSEGVSDYEGWVLVIGWMQAYVEKGETVATRTPLS